MLKVQKRYLAVLGALATSLSVIGLSQAVVLNPHHYLARAGFNTNNISGLTFNNVGDSDALQVGGNPYNMQTNLFITKEGWLIHYPEAGESQREWLETGAIDGFVMNSINAPYIWNNAIRWKGSFYGFNKKVSTNSFEFHTAKILDYNSTGQRAYSMVQNPTNKQWSFYVNADYIATVVLNTQSQADQLLWGIETSATGNNFTNATYQNTVYGQYNYGSTWYAASGTQNIDTTPNTWCGYSSEPASGTFQYFRNCASAKNTPDSLALKQNKQSKDSVNKTLFTIPVNFSLPTTTEKEARNKTEVLPDNQSKASVLAQQVDDLKAKFVNPEHKNSVVTETTNFGSIARDKGFKDFQINDNRQVVKLKYADDIFIVDIETKELLRTITKNTKRTPPSAILK